MADSRYAFELACRFNAICTQTADPFCNDKNIKMCWPRNGAIVSSPGQSRLGHELNNRCEVEHPGALLPRLTFVVGEPQLEVEMRGVACQSTLESFDQVRVKYGDLGPPRRLGSKLGHCLGHPQ